MTTMDFSQLHPGIQALLNDEHESLIQDIETVYRHGSSPDVIGKIGDRLDYFRHGLEQVRYKSLDKSSILSNSLS